METVLCDWLGVVGIFFCAQRCTILPSRIVVQRCTIVASRIVVQRCTIVPSRIVVKRCTIVPSRIVVQRCTIVPSRIVVQRCTIVPSRIVVLRRSHIFVQTVLSMSVPCTLSSYLSKNSKYKEQPDTTRLYHVNIQALASTN